MTRSSRSSRLLVPTAADLGRAALSYALAEGWQVIEHLDAVPGDVRRHRTPEARVIVSGGELPGRCLLRVRERRGEDAWPDVGARRDAASEHVVGVVRELPARRVRRREWDAVLLLYAQGGGLERLLLRERGLRSGEVTTVLLGVATGVAALHEHGWARPELSASGVVFAADGCPALDALDDVTPWEPDAAVADAEAFHALARRVCLAVTDGTGMTLLAAVERGLRQGSWRAVEEAVLPVAAPEAVTLDGVAELRAEVPEDAGTVERLVSREGRTDVRRRVAASVSAAMDFLDGEPARTIARRAGAWLRRRPAVVVVGLLPVVAALAIVGLLPASPAESAPTDSGPAPRARSSASTSNVQPSAGRFPVASPSPSASSLSGASPAAAGPGESPVASGGERADDPVIAAASVLKAWHACFSARPTAPDCLSSVLDGEPAFLAAETQSLGATGSAGARDYAGAGLSLVERWGDAALIGVVPDAARTPRSKPASLLLVRSDGSWRLRAVFP